MMKHARNPWQSLAFMLVAATAGTACGGSNSTEPSPSPITLASSTDGAPTAAGDMIRVAFWRETNLNGDYPVEASGEVILPILGTRQVAGRAADEVRKGLLAEYAGQVRNQEVNVTILRRVRVLGSVGQPGLYYVDATMSVADAIALAGGITTDGNPNDVRLMRDGVIVREDMDQSIPLGSAGIRSGDQINVQQRSWGSRYTGAILGSIIAGMAIIAAAVIQNN